MTYKKPYEIEFAFNPSVKKVSTKGKGPIHWVESRTWTPIFTHKFEGPSDCYRIQFVGEVRDVSLRILAGKDKRILATGLKDVEDAVRFKINLVTRRILTHGEDLVLEAYYQSKKHTSGRIYNLTGSLFQYPGDEAMRLGELAFKALAEMKKAGNL